MGYPKGISWKNGIAELGGWFFFRCKKTECGGKEFRSQDKAEFNEFVNAHNAGWHSLLGKALPGFRAPSEEALPVSEVLDRWEKFHNQAERDKSLEPATVKDQLERLKMLRAHLPLSLDIERVGVKIRNEYIARRRATGKGRGHSIAKELHTLIRAAKAQEVALSWTVPDSLAAGSKTPKRPFTLSDLKAWVDAMESPVVKLLVLTKLYSGVRIVELLEQTAGALKQGGWTVTLRQKNKGRKELHWQKLPEWLYVSLQALAADKEPEELLFTRPNGERITTDWLRYPLSQASIKAKVSCGTPCACRAPKCQRPLIRTFGMLRSVCISLIASAHGTRAAQEFIGHKYESTTAIYNTPERFAEIGLQIQAQAKDHSGAIAAFFPVPD